MRAIRAVGVVVLLALPGCVGCDTGYTDPAADPAKEDDAPPPRPAFDAALAYQSRFGSQRNNSDKRFRFDIASFRDDAERAQFDRLFPSHGAFLAANERASPSVQTLVTSLKQLDDTIYAGVELAVQRGREPAAESKRRLLLDAIAALAASRSAAGDAALVQLAAAVELGGGTAEGVPADLAGQAASAGQAFVQNQPEYATPIGFYTWSEELKQLWRQDRLLQQPLPAASACALATALASDAGLRDRYLSLVQLYAGLTNPLMPDGSLVPILPVGPGAPCTADGDRPFLGRSQSPEVGLFNRLFPNGVPADVDLMGTLVDHIRSGDLTLEPKPGDGWYSHQLFALETLLVTDRSEERAKVAFSARYKQRLREAFATLLVQHRETHVKQLDTQVSRVAKAAYDPVFRLEPLATVYVRHARSYVFLEQALTPYFGGGWLNLAYAVGADGEQRQSLREQIRRARDLYFGLYVLACQDIGLHWKLDHAGDPTEAEALGLAKAADEWLAGLATDPLATADARVIVPIAELGDRTKYWAVIGVRGTLAGYTPLGDDGKPLADQTQKVPLPTEQFLEVISSKVPPTREEFRALCDREKTPEAIRAALERR